MYEEKTKKEFDWKGIALKAALAVVVLVLIIKLLPLDNSKKANNEVSASFKANMTALKDAGYSYFTNEKLPKNVGEKTKVNLGDLIGEGQVKDLKTEDGEACDIENSYAQVTKTVNNYELEINLICGEEDAIENYYLGSNTTTTSTTTTTTATTTTKKSNSGGSSTNNNNSGNKNTNNTTQTKQTTTFQTRYTVVFNTDGGTAVSYQYVNAGNKASIPSNPTKVGYTFAGWYYNGSQFNFNTSISKNMILKAKWVLNNNQTTTTTKKTTTTTTKKPSTTNNSLTIYNRDQYGNYVNNAILTLYKGDCQNKTCSESNMYAKWYTMTSQNPFKLYSLPLGYYTLASTTTPSGYSTPAKMLIYIGSSTSNYTFTLYNYPEVTASSVQTVKVTYDTNGGSTISAKTINAGGYATNYTPTRTNATFIGWYYNGKKFDFNTKINSNITLVAKYNVTETITSDVYSIGWGTKVNSFKVNHTLAIPTSLKSSQYKNVRIKSLAFLRTLSTTTDLNNYDKYRNDAFEGYVTNGWEYTSGVAANLAKISSATIVKSSSNTYDRGVTWTGNVSSQCSTSFNFKGVSNACLYGITYRITWQYEIER